MICERCKQDFPEEQIHDSHDVPCYTNKEGVQRAPIGYQFGESEKYEICARNFNHDPHKFIVYAVEKKKFDGPNGGNGVGPGDSGEGDSGDTGGAGGTGGDGAIANGNTGSSAGPSGGTAR